MAFTFDENGALLVSGPISGSGAAGQVTFWTGAQTQSGDNNLWWDNVNKRLGVGISGPNHLVDILDSNNNTYKFAIDGSGVFTGVTGMNASAAIVRLDADSAADASGIWYRSASIDWFAGFTGSTDDKFVIARESGSPFILIDNSGNTGFNALTPARRTHATDDSASTGTIIPISRIESQVSGGAGAAGHGPGREYYGESSTTENTAMAVTAARWSVATHASRRARFEIRNYYIGNEVLCGVIEAPAFASADGNPRGVGAVDWQGYRGAITRVASGDYSVIAGGRDNTTSGNYSVVCGGLVNTASGAESFVGGGTTNQATASDAAVVGGSSNDASTSLAFIGGGQDNIASGISSVVTGGFDNDATALYSAIPGGERAVADKQAQFVHASGIFAASGDAQGTIQMVARIHRTTHAVNTWYSLYLDGAAVQMTISASTAWTVTVHVVGITQNAAQQWSYKLNGMIERDNAGNTTLGNFNLTTIFESDANYDCQLVADNVNEALEIQVRRTGGVDYNVYWVATINTVEVTYP